MPFASLYDPTALALVAGGTALTAMLRTPAADLWRGVKALRTLVQPRFDTEPLLEQLAAQARIAQRHGVLALDRSVITDPDLAAGLAAVVDGDTPDAVAQLVGHCRRARMERHAAAIEVWRGAAEAAPAMGMVGTLIGLVAMFVRMADPAAIGSAMAVALLATLYGALLANLVFAPVAARLRRIARDEHVERLRLDPALVALAVREQPRAVPAPDLASAA